MRKTVEKGLGLASLSLVAALSISDCSSNDVRTPQKQTQERIERVYGEDSLPKPWTIDWEKNPPQIYQQNPDGSITPYKGCECPGDKAPGENKKPIS